MINSANFLMNILDHPYFNQLLTMENHCFLGVMKYWVNQHEDNPNYCSVPLQLILKTIKQMI